MWRTVVAALAIVAPGVVPGAGVAQMPPLLPPAMPWSGPSERLIARADDPWITPAERAGFRTTPSHAETRAWFERLVAASPLLTLEVFGRTPEGRDLYAIRASKGPIDGVVRRAVLIQAGIHAGEIDGKDAGMMLLRDIALRGKDDLLDRIDLVFVPILNVDGHEYPGAFNRPNQRGPENSGLRTTAQGINLNRDYAKADAPEMQAMLRLLHRVDPLLYVDMHVSDGFDHGYDVTYTFAGWGRYTQSRAITTWLNGAFRSGVDPFVRAMGHAPYFYPSAIDERDLWRGLRVAAEGPRYSTGYGDYARIPTVLVEMHSLKPYRQRVLGAYIFMEAALHHVGRDRIGIETAIAADRADRPKTLAVKWQRRETPVDRVAFDGVALERYRSRASGEDEIRYLARPQALTLPVIGQDPVASVRLPRAWWVPASATDVIARLDLHGISYTRIDAPRTIALDMARIVAPTLGPVSDGRVMVTGRYRHEPRRERFAAGSVRVPCDQPRGLLAAALLEPEAVDSLAGWGFFPTMMQRGSAMERFASAPMADAMLARDPALAAAFAAKVAADPAFARDGQARLDWFVERSPYRDDRYRLYPIGREVAAEVTSGTSASAEVRASTPRSSAPASHRR